MDIAARLDLFIDIVYQGSFAKAADYRNIDRAVVTKQFKALENNLGVRLLNRTTRSIALTGAGQEVLKQAYIVREEISKTKVIAGSFNTEPKGLIRISSFVDFGLSYIQPAICLFMTKYPKVRVELTLDDKLVSIVDEQLDISFRIGPLRDSSNIASKLASMNLAILASKAFIDKHSDPQSLNELANLPAVIYANGSFCFDQIELTNSKTGVIEKLKLNGKFQSNNVQSLLSAMQSGIGYCITDISALSGNIETLGLKQLLKHYKFSTNFGDVYAIYPHRNQTPMVKEFLGIVKEVVGTPANWVNYLK